MAFHWGREETKSLGQKVKKKDINHEQEKMDFMQ